MGYVVTHNPNKVPVLILDSSREHYMQKAGSLKEYLRLKVTGVPPIAKYRARQWSSSTYDLSQPKACWLLRHSPSTVARPGYRIMPNRVYPYIDARAMQENHFKN